mgnify:CR=1 FL=1
MSSPQRGDVSNNVMMRPKIKRSSPQRGDVSKNHQKQNKD